MSDENWAEITEVIEAAIEKEIDRQIAANIDDDMLYTPAVAGALRQAGFSEYEIMLYIAEYFGPMTEARRTDLLMAEFGSFEAGSYSCGFPL